MKFDLHIHSTCSDGRFTPKQVFEEANQRNIKLLSITDHDTIECQQEAIEFAKHFGIKYITGVELTSYYAIPEYNDGKHVQLHLLAYGFNHNDEKLCNLLRATGEKRKTRAN
ncbi:MAG: PHP domain-containing protein, partial [Planctomycetes bacterium]|nr:PHP domain-containing protein [Planctomycetota bacterium]